MKRSSRSSEAPPSLADILWVAAKKDALAAESVVVIEAQVASRRGLRGIALKTGLGLLKSARPDALTRAMHAMLPEFLIALDPLYQAYRHAKAPRGSAKQGFADYLEEREDQAVEALLHVADRKIDSSPNQVLRGMYARLRASAGEEVAAALPRIGELLDHHLKAKKK